ncbi:ribosome biogenesis GTPase Der [Xanthocytophaga agilis]|uniref:GTPase Der n=1 Tax=Xanthocytophaga agilis TaxID=3048010 RepID=A0AAE3RE99_9BACT|nr:ribosome biogenesis GTPase Der [Xanthocytophaga agilis]MDJ1506707.1 ribosome biogenesis GTPase Der [Xanthocytophaga agilis]
MANIIAIVGRPNVGKSTFFNRLIEKRQAIMDNVSGVTRDRHYGHGEWCGKFFTVIDTGGYVVGSDDIFEESIRDQVELAIEEASVLLFMVDADAGLTDLDKDFAHVLRRSKKPVFLVANKADTPQKAQMAGEFYALGLGEVYPISSQTGSGTGELLDEVVKDFTEEGIEDPNAGIPRISILGRPNVGKSSFLNALLGKERSIVTDIAGTTRDAIDTHYKLFGKDFIITDTAGMRRKAKVKDDIEFYSVMRSIRALEDSDICIIMLDATRGIESQDVNIIWLAERSRKGIVIMMNKWDALEKDHKTAEKVKKEILERIAPLDYAPIFFTSVTEKQRIFQTIEKAVEVYENRTQKIATSALNNALLPEIEHYPPPAVKGKYIKIKYITQLPTKTPTFAFFCNLPQYIQKPYERFLENKIREHFSFEGIPINLVFRKK